MNEKPAAPSPEPTDAFGAAEQEGDEVAFACGHRAPSRYKIDAYGTILTPKDEFLRKRERCGACDAARLKLAVTRCVACRRPIFPGDQVAVSTQGVVCMRRDAVGYMGGGALSGHWTGKGVEPLTFHDSPKLGR